MDNDSLLTATVAFGLSMWAAFLIGPIVTPTWYPRVLHAWGARRQVRVEFVLGADRRLREGPEVEAALGRLYVRLSTTLFIGMACVGASYLLLFHGPRLSQSTANSLAVAGLPLLAGLVGAIQLRGFLDPYRTEAGRPRRVGAEDYVWPLTRALAWVLAAAAALVPTGFAGLAAGPSYDADKVWWEGLTTGPLAGVALIVAVEVWLRGVVDAADADDPTLYVWDCLRTRAVQGLYAFALVELFLSFQAARGGLNGVALVGPGPAWLDRASSACWLLQLASFAGLLLVFVQPLAPRLRARLWPGLPATERIEFGVRLAG